MKCNGGIQVFIYNKSKKDVEITICKGNDVMAKVNNQIDLIGKTVIYCCFPFDKNYEIIKVKDSEGSVKQEKIQTTTLTFSTGADLSKDIIYLESFDEIPNADILFLIATSKLDWKISFQASEKYDKKGMLNKFLDLLFQVQPNGELLSQTDLLKLADDYIPFFLEMTLQISGIQNGPSLISQFNKFLMNKLFQNQLFGPTSIILITCFDSYYDKNALQYLIFPIDLEVSNYELFIQNLEIVNMNIVGCDGPLALLLAYQIVLHKKCIEYAQDWINDYEYSIEQFVKIYCERIKATISYHQPYQALLLEKTIFIFNDFALLFAQKFNNSQEVNKKLDEIAKLYNFPEIFVKDLTDKNI